MPAEIDWMFSTMERVIAAADEGGDPKTVRKAFDRFLENLARTADLAEREGMPIGPIDLADGYRNVLFTLHFGLDRVFREAGPYAPAFGSPWPMHLVDWGGASPDSCYRSARLAGGITYRIAGKLGNSPTTSLQFFDGQDICLTLPRELLDPEASGTVEVFVGGKQTGRNWHPLPAGVTSLLLREFFADWSDAARSELIIESVNAPPIPWPRMSCDRVAREFDALGEWVLCTAQFWADRFASQFAQHPNGFEPFMHRDPGVPAISWGHYNIPAGHAWIMEMDVPQSPYWSIQPGTTWWRTLDFANRHASLNNTQASIDSDGKFRAIFAHEDPGIANWIDVQGIERGAALVRIATPPTALATPVGRLIKLADIDREMPHAARTDPATRKAVIDTRRAQITRLLVP